MAEEISAVKKLMTSVQAVISAYADMLNAYAEGREPEVIIDDVKMNMALKVAQNGKNLEAFDKLMNGESEVESIVTTETVTTETTVEKVTATGNPFEERQKKIQERRNGKTD